MTEGELDDLLGEMGGDCSYDNMVKMFQEKMAGEGNDSDDLIVQAFKAYDIEGKIDSKMFTHALMTWGDKMSKAVEGELIPVVIAINLCYPSVWLSRGVDVSEHQCTPGSRNQHGYTSRTKE